MRAPEWVNTAVIYEVFFRYITPDSSIKAFINELPRLRSLGVNTLWFVPIHPIGIDHRPDTLGGPYSVRDFYDINPEYGTKEDFRLLCDKAHEMGFKLMLDIVANHTSWDCRWTVEHPEWYVRDENGGLCTPNSDWKDVVQLNFLNRELWDEMIRVMKYWISEFDIDGFRCDFAENPPYQFWNRARREIDMIKNVFMLAECDIRPWLLEEAFDACYNANIWLDLRAVAKGRKHAFDIMHTLDIERYMPYGRFGMNFIDNHDMDDEAGKPIRDIYGKDAIFGMTALTFMIPGVPLIYNGQEALLDRPLAHHYREAIDWNNAPEYTALIEKLCKMKREYSSLHGARRGAPLEWLCEDNDIISFRRCNENETIYFIFNMSNSEREYDTSIIPSTAKLTLHGVGCKCGSLDLREKTALLPWEYAVYTDFGKES